MLLLLLLLSLVQPAPIAGPNHRFEWDQFAYNQATIDTFSFDYFLDSSTSGTHLDKVTCVGNAPNFVCSAPVPEMGNGVHTIKLSAINTIGESGQSLEFRFRYSKND